MRAPHNEENAVWSPDDWAGPRAAYIEVELYGGPEESAAVGLQYRQDVAGDEVETVTLELPGIGIELNARRAELSLGIGLSIAGVERLRDLLDEVLVDYRNLDESGRSATEADTLPEVDPVRKIATMMPWSQERLDDRPLAVQPLCECGHRYDRHDHDPHNRFAGACYECRECTGYSTRGE